MRSSPLLMLAVVALGFALIAVPLARLTWADDRAGLKDAAVSMLPLTADADSVPVRLLIRYAHAPLRVVVRAGTEVVATFGPPEASAVGHMEQSGRVALGSERWLELLVEAEWPDSTPPTALGLELEPDGFETRRATLWADTPVATEVLSFSWR